LKTDRKHLSRFGRLEDEKASDKVSKENVVKRSHEAQPKTQKHVVERSEDKKVKHREIAKKTTVEEKFLSPNKSQKEKLVKV
jgi:hypothetical protein